MRMLSTYIAFVAAGLLVLMVQFGCYFSADKTDLFERLQKEGIDTSLLVNSFIATRIGMEVGFVLLLAPMIIQTFARQVSGEDSRGTLRLILSRPISRMALLSAKFVVCMIYSLLLMGFFLSMSYITGLIIFGNHDSITIGQPNEFEPRKFAEVDQVRKDYEKKFLETRDLPADEKRGAQQRLREEQRRTERQVRIQVIFNNYVVRKQHLPQRLFVAWLLSTWALLTIGSMAFFFSVINKHPIAAMAATIGAYFLVIILNELASAENIIPLFRALRPYLFSNAMDYWRGCFRIAPDWTEIWQKFRLLAAYNAGFFGLAQLIFWRKDISS